MTQKVMVSNWKMLGFEKTLNWGGQPLFVSAGGYHHHMAMKVEDPWGNLITLT